MTMWDKLCELLRAREVSVEDVSNKVSALQLKPAQISTQFTKESRIKGFQGKKLVCN